MIDWYDHCRCPCCTAEMCIRDRSSAMVDVSLKAYQHGESCEAAIPENNDDAIDHFTAEIQPGQTVNAVSYTHLDVYKRQPLQRL